MYVHSSVILPSFIEAFSSEFPEVLLLFLLSFVSLLLLLSLLFTLFVLFELEGPDKGFAVSFLIMFVGGEPSSCFIEVTINCSVGPEAN